MVSSVGRRISWGLVETVILQLLCIFLIGDLKGMCDSLRWCTNVVEKRSGHEAMYVRTCFYEVHKNRQDHSRKSQFGKKKEYDKQNIHGLID